MSEKPTAPDLGLSDDELTDLEAAWDAQQAPSISGAPSLPRYWKPQGSGWRHIDGTRIEKMANGMVKVISSTGRDLMTFPDAEAAFRFVDGDQK